MSFHQLEEWFDIFRQFGYIPGFIMLYLRAIVPVLPLTLYVVLLMHAYGSIPGIIISWLGIVTGTFTVFLVCKKLINTEKMKNVKKRKSVQRLISFIDRQGLIPLFILLCFPFTPNTLINLVASLSHIKVKYYFIVLTISKLISITILGVMGREVTTIRALIMLLLLVALWFISKKWKNILWVLLRSDNVQRTIKYLISLIFAIIIVLFIQTFIVVGAVIPNHDMSPTMKKDDRVIVNKIKVTFDLLKDGDVIMYSRDNKIHFSRIVGKPGESIEIKNHNLYRDDRRVNQQYGENRQINNIALRDIKDSDGDTVPPDSYFVLNDNDDKNQTQDAMV